MTREQQSMSAHDDPLWQKLREFSIETGQPQLTFTSRLAIEQDWPLQFANDVIREYKRFLYLAVRAGHPVTPSEEIDAAWHLHMTYTRSYWDRLCGQILRQPLHHDPTAGGPTEDHKFREWYRRTLDSYREFFKESPRSDIWPSVEKRFAAKDQSRRSVPRNQKVLWAAFLLWSGLLIWHLFSLRTEDVSLADVLLAIVGVGVYWWLRYLLSRFSRGGGAAAGGCGAGFDGGGGGCGGGGGGGCGGA